MFSLLVRIYFVFSSASLSQSPITSLLSGVPSRSSTAMISLLESPYGWVISSLFNSHKALIIFEALFAVLE